jgi:hypothetical protein
VFVLFVIRSGILQRLRGFRGMGLECRFCGILVFRIGIVGEERRLMGRFGWRGLITRQIKAGEEYTFERANTGEFISEFGFTCTCVMVCWGRGFNH